MTDFDRIELKKWSIRKMLVYTAGVIVSVSSFVWGVSSIIHEIRDSVTKANSRIDVVELRQKNDEGEISFLKNIVYKPKYQQ